MYQILNDPRKSGVFYALSHKPASEDITHLGHQTQIGDDLQQRLDEIERWVRTKLLNVWF